MKFKHAVIASVIVCIAGILQGFCFNNKTDASSNTIVSIITVWFCYSFGD